MSEPFLPTEVPSTYQPYVNRLRAWLGDTPLQNILEQVEESTDLELYMALQDAVTEINEDFDPNTAWTIATVPSWSTLCSGAA